jgi:hypothetical protein
LGSEGDAADIIVEWFIESDCEMRRRLGFGLQESFVVANVHRVVGGLSGALGRVREVFEEAEERGHAVEGCGEGDESNDDVRSAGAALNLKGGKK